MSRHTLAAMFFQRARLQKHFADSLALAGDVSLIRYLAARLLPCSSRLKLSLSVLSRGLCRLFSKSQGGNGKFRA